ncbi:MAG: magnesium transporter [Planctomycetaceae bacterium]
MYHELLLPDLRMMLQEDDQAGMAEFCQVFHPAAVAEVLELLDREQVWKVLSASPLPRQVEIFEFLSLAKQVEFVDSIDRQRLSRLLEEMAPDDRVDLLSRLDEQRVEALLPLIARAERNDIRKLLSFPENSAGAIMTTEYASLPENISVGEAIDRLRRQAPNRETIYYVYILGENRRLDGFVSLRDLILARPSVPLSEIIKREVISVRVDDDQEFVAQELGRYDFIAIPVVDSQNQLVGIVTHDDVLDIVQEEASEDAYRAAAVEPLEDGYLDTRLTTIAWKRGVWLLFLSVMAMMTAEVLERYESVSASHVWMVLFLPLVLASGGNAGSQSATIVIRTMAIGELSKGDNARLLRREPLVGILLGACLAAVDFIVAYAWFGQSPTESGVLAATVFLVVMMGTVNGAMLPMLFKRLNMDPALMSNPLIASLSDVLGVIIYYTVALLLLGAVSE